MIPFIDSIHLFIQQNNDNQPNNDQELTQESESSCQQFLDSVDRFVKMVNRNQGKTSTTTTTTIKDPNDVYLHPPALEKQFLISPPASPPVGWKPVDEAQPLMNVELLSALASLTPGEAHELHPQSESQPGIVVHICEEDDAIDDKGWKPKIKIPQTPHPAPQAQPSRCNTDT